MRKQMLFCIETKKKAKTDKVYIDETIDRFYNLGSNIRKRFIYLDGKGNYNKPKVENEITLQIRKFGPENPTVVIYCIDTDKHDSNPVQANELDAVIKYCEMKGYEFVWFCRDVEDVYWREQVSDSEKTQRDAQFKRGRKIRDVKESNLRNNRIARHNSNIMTILDKHLEKKQIAEQQSR